MDPTLQGHITLEHQGSISTVTFSHPAHNSLPGRLLAQLTRAIDEAAAHPDTRVVVLRSEGDRTFCAGASFDELAAIDTFEKGKAFFLGFANVINAMRKCPKPIVGRVQGKAIGGGVGLAAATDYCLASKWASIRLSELAVGIGPFVVGPAVERKIGLASFSHMTLNPTEWQTAEWAREKGLFTEVCDSVEELDIHLNDFTARLASFNPEALQELKKIFWQGTEHWDELLDERASISGRLVLSNFAREAIAAFKAR